MTNSQAPQPAPGSREAFEAALKTKPEARFWNTTDAMFWAFQAGADGARVPAPDPAQVAPVSLLEAIDYALNQAPCECPHSMRFERGEHMSGCYLFDLNVEYAKTAPAIPAPEGAPLSATVATALRRAFSMGQTYWQQADSDSFSQNAKSDITRGKFEALLEETTAAVAAPAHQDDALHAFKNFHQRLCERFGYFHDEQNWQRDLCSLEEHIAGYVKLMLSARAPRESSDYFAGHADGLEWAARTVELNDPRTGDWRYDDRTELAAAIRKGPEMPAAPQTKEQP